MVVMVKEMVHIMNVRIPGNFHVGGTENNYRNRYLKILVPEKIVNHNIW